jgi:hypothetical protein
MRNFDFSRSLALRQSRREQAPVVEGVLNEVAKAAPIATRAMVQAQRRSALNRS